MEEAPALPEGRAMKELQMDQAPHFLRRVLRPLFFFLLFAVLFHGFWDHAIIFRDGFLFYPALKYYVATGWRAGRVYGWLPWQYLGVPYAADPLAGWFYPLNILFLALSTGLAYRLYVFMHYPLAAVGMDLFLRGRGLDRRSSVLGALAFPLSGYMISQHANLTFLIGPALAPFALYGMDRAIRERSWGWACTTGAALALQVLGGDPQSAAITTALSALIALSASFKSPRRAAPLGLFGLAATSALLFSAVQALPAWHMMQQSLRHSGLPLVEASGFSFNPARAVGLIWPTPFGTEWPQHAYWGRFLLEELLDRPWSFTSYLGAPVLLLAGTGLLAGRRRWRAGLAAISALFFLLALGRHTPVFALFHRVVPLFDRFRYPEKYMAWFSGCAAVAAALGLEEAQIRLRENARSLVRPAVLVMALSLALMAASAALWPLVMDRVPALINDPALRGLAASHLLRGGAQVLAVAVGCGLLLLAAARKKISVERAATILIALTVIDLYLANVSIMPAGSPRIFGFRPPAGQDMSPQGRPGAGNFRIFRDSNLTFRDVNPALAGLTYLERECVWERTTLAANLHALEGFESITGYEPAVPELGYDLLTKGMNARVMQAFNVKHIITTSPPPEVRSAPTRLIADDEANGFSILSLPDFLPRAYWVAGAVAAADEEKAEALLHEIDPSRSVVITTDEPIGGESREDTGLAPATILRYEPDNVEIEVEAPAAGWLVLSDRFYPGWSATLDGSPARIYCANVLVRAVRMGPGKHRVAFRFRTPLLLLGAAISLPCWIAALGWWLIRLLRAGNRTRRRDLYVESG